MPLHTIEPRRLYRQIADQLRASIERGEFAVGSRLPPERDLAVQLGVSRPSVREALIALEVEGLVEVRMGSGVYVREPVSSVDRLVAESPLETILARRLIESELAGEAARRATPGQVRGLREAVDIMEADTGQGDMPIHGDRLFHLRIAEIGGNSVLLRVVDELFDERHNPLSLKLSDYFENPANWASAIAEHKRVIEAIARGDEPGARHAMHEHLSRSHDRFTANWTAAGESVKGGRP